MSAQTTILHMFWSHSFDLWLQELKSDADIWELLVKSDRCVCESHNGLHVCKVVIDRLIVLRLVHIVTGQYCRLNNGHFWTIFFLNRGAPNPEEVLKFDMHTPDVCAKAWPPKYMTCKRVKGVAVHYLRTVQSDMCKLTGLTRVMHVHNGKHGVKAEVTSIEKTEVTCAASLQRHAFLLLSNNYCNGLVKFVAQWLRMFTVCKMASSTAQWHLPSCCSSAYPRSRDQVCLWPRNGTGSRHLFSPLRRAGEASEKEDLGRQGCDGCAFARQNSSQHASLAAAS